MPTLWEIWTTKKEEEVPIELQFYNPYKIRCGAGVKLDTIDFDYLAFNLTTIRAVTREVEGQTFKFCDLDLLARPHDGDPVHARLRLVPKEHTDGDLTHDAILLKRLDEFNYDGPFHKGLSFEDNAGEFQEGDITYWRVNDRQAEWDASVANISDKDQDGTVEEHEVQHFTMKYWDFWAEREIDGATVTEFYIVEMHESGQFTIWVGSLIDQDRVEIA